MTLGDLHDRFRAKIQDKTEPYQFSESDVTGFFNDAEQEACDRAHLIIDKTTDAYCRLALSAYAPTYALNAKVIQVREVYLGASVKGTTFSWTASTRTLADSGSGFLTAGFEAGQTILVTGFTTAANNGLFTIESVVAGSIVVAETTMSNEIAGDTVTIKAPQVPLTKKSRTELDALYGDWQHMYGDPEHFIEEENGEITFVPMPNEANTIQMVVSRRPKEDMDDLVLDSPEINEQYHKDLVIWALKEAHESNDTDFFNLQKAKAFEDQFTKKFGPAPSARMKQARRIYARNPRMNAQEFGF
jgi:hypothetical protein